MGPGWGSLWPPPPSVQLLPSGYVSSRQDLSGQCHGETGGSGETGVGEPLPGAVGRAAPESGRRRPPSQSQLCVSFRARSGMRSPRWPLGPTPWSSMETQHQQMQTSGAECLLGHGPMGSLSGSKPKALPAFLGGAGQCCMEPVPWRCCCGDGEGMQFSSWTSRGPVTLSPGLHGGLALRLLIGTTRAPASSASAGGAGRLRPGGLYLLAFLSCF